MPSFRGEKFFLSNMYPCTVVVAGIVFKCSESAYVAAKVDKNDPNRRAEQSKISLINGYTAKSYGQKYVKLRDDWAQVKIPLMYMILREKFTQNDDLRLKLLATGDEPLVEINEWGDEFWGVCRGKGQNNLGKLLMQLRAELRNHPTPTNPTN